MARWQRPAPVSRVLKLDGVAHAHRCRACAVRYQDACHSAGLDDRCARCRSGSDREHPLWVINHMPQDCCRHDSRLATHDDRKTYHLGGTSTWWICSTCKRTHPNNPKETP